MAIDSHEPELTSVDEVDALVAQLAAGDIDLTESSTTALLVVDGETATRIVSTGDSPDSDLIWAGTITTDWQLETALDANLHIAGSIAGAMHIYEPGLIGGDLHVGGAGSIGGELRIAGPISGDVQIAGAVRRGLTVAGSIGGELRIIGSIDEGLHIVGSIGEDLHVVGSGSIGRQLQIYGPGEVKANLRVAGSIGGGLAVAGSIEGDLRIDGRIGRHLYVDGAGSIGGELRIAGSIDADLHIVGSIGRELRVVGPIGGDLLVEGPIGGTMHLYKAASIGRDLHIDGSIGGDLLIVGSIGGELRIAGSVSKALAINGSVEGRGVLTPGQPLMLASLSGALFGGEVYVGDRVKIDSCDFRQCPDLDKFLFVGTDLFSQLPWISLDRWRGPRLAKPAGATDAEMASVYRRLRTNLEGRSNRPGAAIFYRGEMRSRFWAAVKRGRLLEATLIGLYWLMSGFGLSSWRPVLWFTGLAAIAAEAFLADSALGGVAEIDWTDAFQFSVRSMVSFVSPPLPPAGGILDRNEIWLQLGLRFVGPLLLAQLALAVRDRVAR